MNKHSLSAIILATALSANVSAAPSAEGMAAAEWETKKETSGALGFTSGAIVGGLAAGPLGAVVGAIGGALFSDREVEHAQSAQQLSLTQGTINTLEQELTMQEAQIAELENHALARMELKVFFETGVDQVSELDNQRLKAMADYLNENPQVSVSLDGHADPRGTDGYNNILSRERAATVKTLLVEKGIDEQRISTAYHGSSRSRAANGDLHAYAQERRVDIELEHKADPTVSQR